MKGALLPLLLSSPLLLLLLLANPLTSAAAVTAKYDSAKARINQGAYLGCFNGTALQLNFTTAAKLAPDTANKCLAYCRCVHACVRALASAPSG